MGYVTRGRESCPVTMHNCPDLPFLGNTGRPYFGLPLPRPTPSPAPLPIKKFLRSPGGIATRSYLSRHVLSVQGLRRARRNMKTRYTRGRGAQRGRDVAHRAASKGTSVFCRSEASFFPRPFLLYLFPAFAF